MDDLAALTAPGDRLLGLDLGTKTIGTALSLPGLDRASPHRTLPRAKFGADAERLRLLVAEHGVAAIVLGLPVNMNGTEGPRAQASRAYARNLARALALPVALIDERLTTVEAERLMIEADASRARRRAAVDSVAAALILQGALDRLAVLRRHAVPSPLAGEG